MYSAFVIYCWKYPFELYVSTVTSRLCIWLLQTECHKIILRWSCVDMKNMNRVFYMLLYSGTANRQKMYSRIIMKTETWKRTFAKNSLTNLNSCRTFNIIAKHRFPYRNISSLHWKKFSIFILSTRIIFLNYLLKISR